MLDLVRHGIRQSLHRRSARDPDAVAVKQDMEPSETQLAVAAQ
jgi:hypothetical protein